MLRGWLIRWPGADERCIGCQAHWHKLLSPQAQPHTPPHSFQSQSGLTLKIRYVPLFNMHGGIFIVWYFVSRPRS